MLFAEPLRRRTRVRFGGAWVADTDVLYAVQASGQSKARDIRRTSRHLVIRDGDRVVADTSAPLVLYESRFAPAGTYRAPTWTRPRSLPVGGQTFCPCKDLASCYDIGGAARGMAAWSYRRGVGQRGRDMGDARTGA